MSAPPNLSPNAWQARSLTDLPVLLLDAQTSGLADAELIQVGWQLLLPMAASQQEAQARFVAMAEPDRLPRKITRLTGITPEDLEDAASRAEVIAAMCAEALTQPTVVVIHYAAFERRFLGDVLARPEVLAVVCSHKLSGRLWPRLPSKSLRSVSGYLGLSVAKLKRSEDHIAATAAIWQAAVARCAAAGVTTWAGLLAVVAGEPLAEDPDRDEQSADQSTGKSAGSQEGRADKKTYPLPRAVRLALPTRPGVYHLKAADGRLLYVGKAVDLKARVNSYFRGQKTKGSRLNELVSQVHDVDYHLVGSGLEAELTEQRHIAKYQPPYNVALVESGDKAISYCDHRLALVPPAEANAPTQAYGPLLSVDTVELLAVLCAADFDPADVPEPLLAVASYYQTPLTELFAGIGLFRQQVTALGLRSLALRRWHHDRRMEAVADAEASEGGPDAATPTPWQAEDVCAFLQGRLASLVRRAHRGRWLRRLSYADLWWTEGGRSHGLMLRGSKAIFGSPADILPGAHRRGRGMIASRHDYDRAAIVLAFIKTQLNNKPHEGLWLRCYPGQLLPAQRLRRLLPGLNSSRIEPS